MNYDIIGDIHGNADKLKQLLSRMGYQERGRVWKKPGHPAIFVGDFVDRGPRQVETVRIVRRMVKAETALAIMGNHEFNAIAWHTEDPKAPGSYLRPRHGEVGKKNRKQHHGFLVEVEGKPEHGEIIEWFMELPLWLDLPELRVIHACWHDSQMALISKRLQPGHRLNTVLVEAASRPGSPEYRAIECLLKGLEIDLPEGHAFQDKDGHERKSVRLRWWNPEADTYRKASILGDPTREATLPDIPIPDDARIAYTASKPVFFGHYWMTGIPAPQSARCACVDYSAGKGGPLVAYRWGGEPELARENFIGSD